MFPQAARCRTLSARIASPFLRSRVHPGAAPEGSRSDPQQRRWVTTAEWEHSAKMYLNPLFWAFYVFGFIYPVSMTFPTNKMHFCCWSLLPVQVCWSLLIPGWWEPPSPPAYFHSLLTFSTMFLIFIVSFTASFLPFPETIPHLPASLPLPHFELPLDRFALGSALHRACGQTQILQRAVPTLFALP